MHRIHDDLAQGASLAAIDVAASHFPKTPLTIVPLAISLACIMRSAASAILLATNVGGDSDSVASIAGAILGARFPCTINDQWFDVVETVNDHGLIRLAEGLSQIRT
jgi:ADP-ribosylglycohydrolase